MVFLKSWYFHLNQKPLTKRKEDQEIVDFVSKYEDLQLASEGLAAEIVQRNKVNCSSADNHSFVLCKFLSV